MRISLASWACRTSLLKKSQAMTHASGSDSKISNAYGIGSRSKCHETGVETDGCMEDAAGFPDASPPVTTRAWAARAGLAPARKGQDRYSLAIYSETIRSSCGNLGVIAGGLSAWICPSGA
jgi:hypothetical protein